MADTEKEPVPGDISSASNTLTSVTAAPGGTYRVVMLTGKLSKVDGYSWSLHGIIHYLSPSGFWAYCGDTMLDTLQIGPDVYYHGQTSALFQEGHSYSFETVIQLLDGQGQVALTAYSQRVVCTIPGS